ncbi:MAG: hypothetical protein RLZZ86_3147 [Cyanobacteriota bacterium]|jgi:hypothetical protein
MVGVKHQNKIFRNPTHLLFVNVGFRSSTQPTKYVFLGKKKIIKRKILKQDF